MAIHLGGGFIHGGVVLFLAGAVLLELGVHGQVLVGQDAIGVAGFALDIVFFLVEADEVGVALHATKLGHERFVLGGRFGRRRRRRRGGRSGRRRHILGGRLGSRRGRVGRGRLRRGVRRGRRRISRARGRRGRDVFRRGGSRRSGVRRARGGRSGNIFRRCGSCRSGVGRARGGRSWYILCRSRSRRGRVRRARGSLGRGSTRDIFGRRLGRCSGVAATALLLQEAHHQGQNLAEQLENPLGGTLVEGGLVRACGRTGLGGLALIERGSGSSRSPCGSGGSSGTGCSGGAGVQRIVIKAVVVVNACHDRLLSLLKLSSAYSGITA